MLAAKRLREATSDESCKSQCSHTRTRSRVFSESRFDSELSREKSRSKLAQKLKHVYELLPNATGESRNTGNENFKVLNLALVPRASSRCE